MTHPRLRILAYLTVVLPVAFCAAATPSDNQIANAGFEQVKDGRPASWSAFWTRTADAGTFTLDESGHGGERAVRVEHRGDRDWCLNHAETIDVQPGEIFELSGWIATDRADAVSLAVITYDDKGTVLDWSCGSTPDVRPGGWRHVRSRFIIPEKAASIRPRILGYGPATVRVDDLSLIRTASLSELGNADLPEELRIRNADLELLFRPADASFRTVHRRTGGEWAQSSSVASPVVLTAARRDNQIEAALLDVPTGARFDVTIAFDRPSELLVTIQSEGDLMHPLAYPHPFLSDPDTRLIVPMNEGIGYPASDPAVNPMTLIAYGGHGICMPFWGAVQDGAARMAILETPDDAQIRIDRTDGLLNIAPVWVSQKGRFGYPRRIRYVFFRTGDHVDICKHYRDYARQSGLLKTLQEKRRENPNVDRLVGAANVWCWESNPLELIADMQSLGMQRILWSRRQDPQTLERMNDLPGVLTSRYDIYQDLMDPQIVREKLRGAHADWTQDGWPEDLMLDEHGRPREGWRVKGKDGQMYPCGVLCDRQAPDYARRRVSEELKTHPYRCRFIDTTTASPWRECYHPDHPMTRTDSRKAKMELLRCISEEMGLVTGSETGHDAAVPYVHYFEGMLSLGPYRVPDAGRNMRRIVEDVPDRVARFQVGHEYRLPLWELVYHDCVVAQWYWGDYNNKLPAIWKKRDLFNILYGTPPMYMFDRALWRQNREQFAESYRRIAPVVRAVGYAEMTDHNFLTADRSVQQTVFDNGCTITVNFGDRPYALDEKTTIPPADFHVLAGPSALSD